MTDEPNCAAWCQALPRAAQAAADRDAALLEVECLRERLAVAQDKIRKQAAALTQYQAAKGRRVARGKERP